MIKEVLIDCALPFGDGRRVAKNSIISHQFLFFGLVFGYLA